MAERFPRICPLALKLLILPGMFCAFFAAAQAQDHIAPLNVREGDKAPDFALQDGNGRTVRLSDFQGHDVLLDFFRGYW